MKNVYLENTNNHHDKFYHMIENKDGASFTASWGRTGSNGRTQIYGMNEWDMKYREKINKGYKDTTIVPPSSNWIQGMSVAQRKKQGITTVQPLVRPKKVKKKPKAIKKTAKSWSTQKKKLDQLKVILKEWESTEGAKYNIDSKRGRQYIESWDWVCGLIDVIHKRGKDSMFPNEMKECNLIYNKYKLN